MEKTFLFYDTETSGLSPAFDQILTFACIRTRLNLSEIDRQTITIRLREDIVPSPDAFLTHGLTYDQLEKGICEYQAARKIYQLFNTPGTISLGYNSLRFDDEFLRFLFYRNLLDPYRHQYKNGCMRMDMLPVTVVYHLFKPEILSWPRVDTKSTLKLEHISSENRFCISGRAHEAMSDVEAVVALAGAMQQQKEIWDYCSRFFDKSGDDARINKIQSNYMVNDQPVRISIMLSASFGAEKNYMAPVMYIGQSHKYKNQRLWMRLDVDDIPGLTDPETIEEGFVVRKKPGDEYFVLPALDRYWEKITSRAKAQFDQNFEKILAMPDQFLRIVQYHQQFQYPFVPSIDPDAALYQEGFFSSEEKRQGEWFHKAVETSDTPPPDLYEHVSNTIQSPRIKNLARRILLRNFSLENQSETDDVLGIARLRSSLEEDQIIGYKNDTKRSQLDGLQQLEILKKKIKEPLDEKSLKLVSWLDDYIRSL